ncbi:MAG: Tfp pilus assembly protein FimT/FimU [Chthoniobacteraceae bacterium]
MRNRHNKAFTLLELLVVMAVFSLLAVVVMPAVSSIGGGQSLTNAASDISSTLEQARAYAMANNTYVYVGFYEADASQPVGVRPQKSGIGRLYVAVVTSKDGTSGYSDGTWSTATVNPNLVNLGKLQHFDGVHLVDKSIVNTLTHMDLNTANNLDLSTDSATPFSAPIGASVATCTFSKVIQFSSSGAVNRITDLTANPAIPSYIQWGIVPAYGNHISSSVANCAGIQMDGLTGSVRIFRPGQP